MKEGWTYKKLGEVCDIIGGGTPDRKNTSYYNGIIPWATVGDMNCEYLSSTDSYITEDGLRNSASRIIGRGEVIIATRVGLGKVCKLSQDTAINQDLKGVIPKEDNIDRGFLYYYFKEKARYIEANGVGATVKGVKIKFVEDLDFPLIDLKVQQRIVKRLDAAFENIDKLKANAEKQLAEAQTLFQKSLAKAMEPKEGWDNRNIEEVCNIVNGYAFPSLAFKQEGEVRAIKITNVGVGQFVEDAQFLSREYLSSAKEALVYESDIVVALTRTIINGGLKVAVVPSSYNGSLLNQRVAALRVKPQEIIMSFLYYFFQTKTAEDYVLKRVNTLMQPNLSIKDLRNMPLTLPSLAEQQRIVERLDALSENIRKYEEIQRQIISECDALKQALLRKVFE